MIVEISPAEINLMPATTAAEVSQNVRMIVLTLKKSVPLDRQFGLDSSLIDVASTAAQAKITAEITRAVNECEPRCKVKRVLFGDGSDGKISIEVEVELWQN